MVWNIVHHNRKLMKENDELKRQLVDVREEKAFIQQKLNETREEFARTRLDMQDQIEDLLHQVAVLKAAASDAGMPDPANESSSTSMIESPDRNRTKETTFALLAGISNNESIVEEVQLFESTICGEIDNFSHEIQMLRRFKAVSVVGQSMRHVDSEKDLYENVTRLMVALFNVDRCSFSILADHKSFTIVSCNVTESEFTIQYPKDKTFPSEGTAILQTIETCKPVYCPDMSQSSFKDHKMIASMGLQSCMNAPILINDGTHPFTLNVALKDKESLTKYDQLLINDTARMLGENILLFRLRKAEKENHKISRQLLYALCPESIIKKIQHHWEEDPSISRQGDNQQRSISEHEERGDDDSTANGGQQTTLSHQRSFRRANRKKMRMIDKVTNNERAQLDPFQFSRRDSSMSSSSSSDSCTRALYAEDVYDVCIVFADIVGFSKIALKISPLEIMDMLQELFSLFDALCEQHKVLKLETIGDAFLGSTGLLEEDDEDPSLEGTAPQRALAFAKDMVEVASTVQIPIPDNELDGLSKTVSVRVGVHCGDATCGVLGQNLPKFSVFGTTVNMAARMEQSCLSDRVHVTEDFFHLVKNGENLSEWEGPRTVSVKNMGDVQSWLWDPSSP